jgi:N-formylglutamate amidohydrolase
MGYTVAHNKPYAGGFITEHYGRPARGLHAIQIEVNRGLYMNERTLQKSAGFAALAADLARFAAGLTAMPRGDLLDLPLAAE